MDILEAMRGRRATRAFLDKPVARETVEEILEAARWAPSGVNIQPWQVAVVMGATKARLSEAMLAARTAGEPERPDYVYYPKQWAEPYKERRKVCGITMYKAMKIGKDDTEARIKTWNANYNSFGAPVALFFFVDRALAQGAWLDNGMFIENVMLAARAFGLDTCPQASLAEYPDLVRTILGIPETRALICGMALGFADTSAAVNSYRLERVAVNEFTQWYE